MEGCCRRAWRSEGQRAWGLLSGVERGPVAWSREESTLTPAGGGKCQACRPSCLRQVLPALVEVLLLPEISHQQGLFVTVPSCHVQTSPKSSLSVRKHLPLRADPYRPAGHTVPWSSVEFLSAEAEVTPNHFWNDTC